ncbi:hypothetical protein HPB52_022790 [Rhipicephalus sanguineus]|uniref:RRM domain-containing protein n=1 Tax=Rhipicephalus sanguineus TaxID=34632 RepID=A0A9D4QFR5_RHISA|nr:hypothetical protein HPB52_022790 [Rhipicephalus sanguineus]
MATVPVEETVGREEAPRGPAEDEIGGGRDAASYCNSGGGAGRYEPGDDTSRSNEGAVATESTSSGHSTSIAYSAPRTSAGSASAVYAASDSIGTCEYGAPAGDHVTGDAAEAAGADGTEATSLTVTPATNNGNSRSGKTSAARVEPAVVPPSVHYGVYVNNIPLDVEDDQLKALFKPYGEVLRLKLVRRPEFTSFLFAYVLLDSDDNTKRAIQELDGTVLNGQALKMEPTFGRTTHIFGIGEGTPYNRSRAALEEWRQNRDAQRANGNRNRQHDDQWRRGNNDRNYRQGDRRFGDWNNGYRRYGDRGNYNDHRHGGGGGGYNRFGGYRQNNNQYNNRYDNNRNFSRRGGYYGDGGGGGGGGGGHWQHGHHSFGGRNQGGGYRPADDGQWRQRGRGQNRYDDDFNRRGDGGHEGGNRSGEDDSHVSYQVFQEARRKMRDAWTRRLERMAAEGNDEEWPTFEELLQLVRHTPYKIPTRDAAANIEDEEEDTGPQPVFWWSRDQATGGGGDGFGPAQAPRTVLELLRWRHGDDAVAEVFHNFAEEPESAEDGGACLIVSGGADGEERARSSPREHGLSVVPEDRDGGVGDGVVAVVGAGEPGERKAAEAGKRDKAYLEQGQSLAEDGKVEQQPTRDDESTLAEGKTRKESILHAERGVESRSAPTSVGKNSQDVDGASGNASVGASSTLSSSADVSVDSLDLSAKDSCEWPTGDDTLHSEFASRCSVSLSNQQAVGKSADGQVYRQEPPRSSKTGADITEQPSRKAEAVSATDCTGEGAGERRGSSNTESATTAELAQVIARNDSACPNATDSAKREAAAASQDVKPGKTERNLSVADQLQFSVEATKDDAEPGEADDGRPQREVGMVTATMADRAAALASWNRAPVARDAEDCEDEADEGDDDGDDESEYSSEGESFCAEIIVRMKNARNAMHLSGRRDAAESSSAHAAEERRLPSERPASNVISQLLAANEDVPQQSERSEPFEFGRPSNSIAVHASSAETDLRYRDSGGMAAVEELASVVRGVRDELRSLLLDDSEGDLPTCTVAGGSGERGVTPKETRPFQRAKRRQRQNVADSIAHCLSPGLHSPKNTAREDALSAGNNGDFGVVARQNEEDQEQKKDDEGVETSNAVGEGGTRGAFRRPRKRVFEDDSDTDDEPSDSEVDDWVRRTTSRARVGEWKAADDADYSAEAAEDVVAGSACAATKIEEGRLIEQRPGEEDGALGDGGCATGGDVKDSSRSDVTSGSDGVTSDYVAERDASGRDHGGEDQSAMTCEGIEKGAQDGGGAQQTADEQGVAHSSRAGGCGVDSSETGRRDDAVDTRRSPRASRHDEEIECKPGDDGE